MVESDWSDFTGCPAPWLALVLVCSFFIFPNLVFVLLEFFVIGLCFLGLFVSGTFARPGFGFCTSGPGRARARLFSRPFAGLAGFGVATTLHAGDVEFLAAYPGLLQIFEDFPWHTLGQFNFTMGVEYRNMTDMLGINTGFVGDGANDIAGFYIVVVAHFYAKHFIVCCRLARFFVP